MTRVINCDFKNISLKKCTFLREKYIPIEKRCHSNTEHDKYMTDEIFHCMINTVLLKLQKNYIYVSFQYFLLIRFFYLCGSFTKRCYCYKDFLYLFFFFLKHSSNNFQQVKYPSDIRSDSCHHIPHCGVLIKLNSFDFILTN